MRKVAAMMQLIFRRRPVLDPADLAIVRQYLGASTWREMEATLRHHSEVLLRPDTQRMIAWIATAEPDDERHRHQVERLALLRACEELGIDAGLGEVSGGEDFVPTDMLANVQEAEFLMGEFMHTGNTESMQHSETLYKSLLADHRLDDLPRAWRKYLWMTASSAADLAFDVRGRPDDLMTAIDRAEMAVRCSHPRSSDHAPLLASYSNELLQRYRYFGATDDLRRAVELMEEAVDALEPAEPSGRALVLNNLCGALTERFLHDGAPFDLDRAIAAAEEAVALVDHSDWFYYARYRSTYAGALVRRAMFKDRLRDLDRGLEVINEALNVVPTTSKEHPNLAQLLATFLAFKAGVFGSIQDFAVAAQLTEGILAALPPDAPLAQVLRGNVLSARLNLMGWTGDYTDLDETVIRFRQLVAENDNPSLQTTRQFGYAQALDLATQVRGATEERLRAQVDVWQSVLESPALTLGQRVGALTALGLALLRLADSAARVAARARFRAAAELVQKEGGGAATAMPDLAQWGAWAIDQHAWDDAVDAYENGQLLLDVVVGAEPFRDYQRAWLQMGPALAVGAAYAHARLGRPEDAVTVAEYGRARMLTAGVLAEPAAVRDAERAGRLEPVARYRAAAARYRRLTADTIGVLAEHARPSHGLHEARARQLDDTTEEIHAALRELRVTATPERPWTPSAPPGQTLAYVIVCSAGAVSLVVREAGSVGMSKTGAAPVEILWHDELTTARLVDAYRDYADGYAYRRADPGGWRAALARTTRWLGRVVMADLVDAVDPDTVLTVIPTGMLGLMPLHAAVVTDPTVRAIDRVHVRYVPNARVLTARRPPISVPDDSLLVVDALDGDALALLDPPGFRMVTHLHGPSAIDTEVISNLRRNSVMHFACHGVLDSRDFRRSRLKLNGDTALTVAAISAADLSPLSLVVAAACESGLHAAQLPDELIGLPAAFLELGASGVIASQWAVPKAATTRLMRMFYQEWRAGNSAHPADALRQAQLSLRDEGENELERWAGFVYLGA